MMVVSSPLTASKAASLLTTSTFTTPRALMPRCLMACRATLCPARPWPLWVPRAPASRPPSLSFPVSTMSRRVASSSMVLTSVPMTRSGCVCRSALCRRNPCFSPCRSRRTSCTVQREPPWPTCSAPPRWPTPTTSSCAFPTPTRPRWVSAVLCFPVASASVSPSRVLCSRIPRSCFSTRPLRPSTPRTRSLCRRPWTGSWWGVLQS
mmetsp:Transcript_95367/g.139254  ORF Transcript_95367/g.139254 Transcript_95367/m.139254 type:complete len:207 (-) Transcript_95367:769-1389(-)